MGAPSPAPRPEPDPPDYGVIDGSHFPNMEGIERAEAARQKTAAAMKRAAEEARRIAVREAQAVADTAARMETLDRNDDAARWQEQQVKRAAALVSDGRSNVQQPRDTPLERLGEQTARATDGQDISFIPIPEPHYGMHAYFSVPNAAGDANERWYVRTLLLEGNERIYVACKSHVHPGTDRFELDRTCQFILRAAELYAANGQEVRPAPGWQNLVRERARSAEADRLSEFVDAARRRNLDDWTGTIGYAVLADQYSETDTALSATRESARHLPRLLSRPAGNARQAITYRGIAEPITVGTESPLDTMRRLIDVFAASNITTIRFYLVCHGAGGFVFRGRGRNADQVVTYEDLMGLFRQYPRCRFLVESNACFGGQQGADLSEAMQDVPGAEPGRVRFLMQTREYAINAGPYHDLFRAYYLSRGMGEGTALHYADWQTQLLSGFNATMIGSVPRGSRVPYLRTASLPGGDGSGKPS